MSDRQTAESPRRAGAFGFTRREMAGLLTAALLVASAAGFQIMRGSAESEPLPLPLIDLVADTVSVDSAVSDKVVDERIALLTVEYDHRTDINSAGKRDLIRLPGIGEVLAGRIIASREKDGPFRDLADLQRVFGIGPKKAAVLAAWVRFDTIPKLESGDDE